MKSLKLTLAAVTVAVASPFVFAQTTTTVTTTTGAGTIAEYAPGQTIVVRESSGPVRYRIRKDVRYVTRAGRVLTTDEVTTRVRVGAPINVRYVKEGDDLFADEVELDLDDD